MKDRHCAVLHEHYHVTDAGMRTVLETLCTAFRHIWPDAAQYMWYSPYKYQHIKASKESFVNPHVKLIEDAELGYLTRSFDSPDQFKACVTSRISAKSDILGPLLRHHKKVVHLIQNPTLLKNPVETQANAGLAQKYLGQNYVQIWHIHDLLEDADSRGPLRAHIRTLVGADTETIYGVNGSGLGWVACPNIVYAVINTKARRALQQVLPPPWRDAVFYLPDAVDLDAYGLTVEPLRGEGIDDLMEHYCLSNTADGYRFDRSAELLIAAEMARERKNTGEQLLILNMLNARFERTGRTFQLLVTMLPQTGDAKERIEIFKAYIRSNKLPVLMGFGPHLIARGTKAGSGRMTLADLWNHPRAVVEISTAVKEGFGLNFLHPAIATAANSYTLPTVGRRLQEVFPDFEAAGMVFPKDAYYDEILVDASILCDGLDYRDQKKDILQISEESPNAAARSTVEAIALSRDFCTYSAAEQVCLLERIDYRKLNRKLARFLDCILDKERMNSIAKHNAAAIKKNLSITSYAGKLKAIIAQAFMLKDQRIASGETPTMLRDNRKLMAYYRDGQD
jgi:hypothetical protein